MLVKVCTCGAAVDDAFEDLVLYEIPCLKCPDCEVVHQQVDMTPGEYQEFYTGDYHTDHQTAIGHQQYRDRLAHDRAIARQRLKKYQPYLRGKRLLDVGSANGAFVLEAREEKFGAWDAWGVEINTEVSPLELTYQGALLEEEYFLDEDFDTVTMHDVLEHFQDPVAYLKEAHRILSPGGALILDMPDYYTEAGRHHWRLTEHLWFFDKTQLCKILADQGFKVTGEDKPIPSKYVLYTEKL